MQREPPDEIPTSLLLKELEAMPALNTVATVLRSQEPLCPLELHVQATAGTFYTGEGGVLIS